MRLASNAGKHHEVRMLAAPATARLAARRGISPNRHPGQLAAAILAILNRTPSRRPRSQGPPAQRHHL